MPLKGGNPFNVFKSQPKTDPHTISLPGTPPIQTICMNIDEQNKKHFDRNNNNDDNNNNKNNKNANVINLSDNNNNIVNIITSNNNKWRKLKCLPDIFSSIDLNAKHGLDGNYNFYKSNGYDNESNGFAVQPASSHGSINSITTTSIASSEDPRGGHDSDGKDFDDKLATKKGANIKQEEWWKTTLQVSIPFLIAGIGTIGAGVILGRVEHWKVFTHITELFILVPALLGLKGNLDMCLASRLSTQANLGNMTSKREIVHMIVGNISLVQVQATVASFIVAIFAITVGSVSSGVVIWDHAMLLIASSMFTATVSCFVLDFVLVAVILLSHRFRMNPDNLATPLAASIGDVVSLSVLSFIASLLFEYLDTHLWVTFLVVCIYSILLPIWVFIVFYNKYTRPVLKSGWIPVLSALFISGMGGFVLDTAVGLYNGFVVFQPIINGIGGNLVSVQASKISTMLHQSSIIGIVPPHVSACETPWRALFKGVPYARSARILIFISIPGQILFIYAADYIHMSTSTIGFPFVLTYLAVSSLQICTLLYIAHIMIHFMWKNKIDPDNSAIPYLTALGDLFGSVLLLLAFVFLTAIGNQYGNIQESIGPQIDLIAST